MTRQDWAEGFCAYAGFPGSREKTVALVAQAAKEDSQAAYNPLDTEEPGPNTTDYNSAGVKNYPSLLEGYGATLATFRNGYYPNLLAILEDPAGGSALAYAASPDLVTWGTGNCVNEVNEINNGDPNGYMTALISPATPEPAPTPPINPTPMEDTVTGFVDAQGTQHVFVANPDGHLVAWTLPAGGSWSVVDLTAQEAGAFPAVPAALFEVAT